MKTVVAVSVAILSVIVGCSSSSETSGPGGGKAPGGACEEAKECGAFTCTCSSGTKLNDVRICENKSCATEARTCEAACGSSTATPTTPAREPTGPGRPEVCDAAVKAFADCPLSPMEIANCKREVADENCGVTSDAYYACAAANASCMGGRKSPVARASEEKRRAAYSISDEASSGARASPSTRARSDARSAARSARSVG